MFIGEVAAPTEIKISGLQKGRSGGVLMVLRGISFFVS